MTSAQGMSDTGTKTILVLIIISLIRLTNQKDDFSTIVAKQCVKSEGANLTLAIKAFRMEGFNNDQKVKCVLKCWNVKMSLMDKNGNVTLDNFITAAPAEAKADIQACCEITDPNVCEIGFKLYQCIMQARKKYRI